MTRHTLEIAGTDLSGTKSTPRPRASPTAQACLATCQGSLRNARLSGLPGLTVDDGRMAVRCPQPQLHAVPRCAAQVRVGTLKRTLGTDAEELRERSAVPDQVA